MSIIRYVITSILCFVLVFSENASDTRDIANISIQDYKVIEEISDNALHSPAVSEAEEHHGPHVEQYEGAGDGDYAIG